MIAGVVFMDRSSFEFQTIGVVHCQQKYRFETPRQGVFSGCDGEIELFDRFGGDAIADLAGFERIWVIFCFHLNSGKPWKAKVQPPFPPDGPRRSIFATRSPYRVNPIGLSCVELVKVEKKRLFIRHIDMLDGTPIFDIKPYIPVADCRPEAAEGYTAYTKEYGIEVDFPKELLLNIPEEKRDALIELLSGDPRPGYDDSPDKRYGLTFASFDIGFTVESGILRVFRVDKKE